MEEKKRILNFKKEKMEQKKFNPNIPAEAIEIIDIMSQDLQLKRNELIVFNHSINTLRTFIALKPMQPEDDGKKKKQKQEPPKNQTS